MNKFIILIAALTISLAACKKGGSPAPASGCDRQITLTVDKATPATGTNITFTLVALNNGPDAATGVSVSEALPAGYSFVSASATTGSYASGVWNGFGLSSGASATLTIVAKVNATGDYTNTATISGVESDPVAGNDKSTVKTTPTAPTVLMVSTLAGSGVFGFMDGPGTTAKFAGPRGLAVDAAGNVYVADYSNDLIRKITAAGVVSTLAGSTNGFAEGMGAAAKFKSPNSVAVDASGNVYVADAQNNRVRKITPAGLVTTIAGDASTAVLSQPLGVGVDAAGNVYIADANNSRICKVPAGGGAITVLAGSATGGSGSAGYAEGMGTAAKFSTPNGVVIDAAGNVFVSDAGNHAIRKITAAGLVSTLAGGTEGYAEGTGTAARFENLSGPAIDASGNIFVADIGNNHIRKITPAGVVTSFAGSSSLGFADGPVTTALFANAYAVTIDAAGNLYVSDMDNSRIRKIGY